MSSPQAGGDGGPSNTPSLLDSLGAEITRIVAPVSACMLLVVLLVSALSSSSSPPTAAAPFPSTTSDSIWSDLSAALVSSLVFVAVVTALTFLLVLLFYLRCTRCLKAYMAFSSLLVLAFLGGDVSLLLARRFSLPLDPLTFLLLLANFSVVGVAAVFSSPAMPIVLTQAYLVIIGVLVAYWFTLLPEWTTWALLVAMALYDLAAVLLPGGPLRLLVELAIARNEDIPALVYEARPVDPNADARRGNWRPVRPSRDRPESNSIENAGNNCGLNCGESAADTRLVISEERPPTGRAEIAAPLIQQRPERREEEVENVDGIGLSSSGAIKLGLGDFIFYSVLVGRAAMYDFMTLYACYLAIIAGLGITLLLLAFYQKALPALPVSILLGVLFYGLTRLLLELFVVQCSINLLMF